MTELGARVDPSFEALLDFLKRNRGFDFSGYKRSSLVRRVVKRMNMVGLQGFTEYMDYLEVYPEEFVELFNTILINVTSFFRDKDTWDYVKESIVPRILMSSAPEGPIRVWSAGCASGQEAYTVAMVLCEALGEKQFHERVKIYATDIDEDALAEARSASYGLAQMENVSEDLRMKYFTQVNDRFVFRQDLRRTVIFGRHDLVQDAPISRLDLLICRNTLMYLNAETQSGIIARMHFALKNSGFLFLGRAEMLLSHTNLFTQIDLQNRVFAKSSKRQYDRPTVLGSTQRPKDGNYFEGYPLLRELSYDSSIPAQIALDENGCLFLANNQARATFGLVSGDVGRPFQDLDISYRPLELRSLVERCILEKQTIKVQRTANNLAGLGRIYAVRLAPLLDESQQRTLGVCISFEDISEQESLSSQLGATNEELQTTKEELQSTNEELETTNEELQSTNEELETTNAELHSTNGELETTNEELQSINEALEVTNEELHSLAGNIDNRNIFLEAILSSIPSGVIAIDDQFQILVWNERSEDQWGLRAEEVVSKKLSDIDVGLPLHEVVKILIDPVTSAADHNNIKLSAINRRGRSVSCDVRITKFNEPGQRRGWVILVDE